MIGGVLISLCIALLGVNLVLRRFSMIGDGLSHVGFGALALAGRTERVQELFRLGYGLDSADAAEREAAVKTEGEKNHG